MKVLKCITTILIMILTISVSAQQSINYKALIKDGGGNVVASQAVTIQFVIYEGAALTNNVYQETHTPNTDANGIIIINIGEGAVDSGVFADINWGSDDHYLNVQINTGGGLTDMGTTQFMAVPYALHAETATTASNVTGLETLDEGNGIGWRIIGRTPNNYGIIGSNAVDLSFSSVASSTLGATGIYATAMGRVTTASGDFATAMGSGTTASGGTSTAMGASTIALGNGSTAMGASTTASGDISTAMGNITTASGVVSTAIGFGTTASGIYSTAMGRISTASGAYTTAIGLETKAEANNSLAIGRYNVGGGNPNSWVATDNLFEVGNGTSDGSRSNAFTILKNGTITAPTLTNSLIDTAGDKALITKEYLEANGSSGLEALDEGNGIGWRLIGQNPANYGNIGSNAVDLSYSSASSSTKGATGLRSVALGTDTTASGTNSTAMGQNTTASGIHSTAMGLGTFAGLRSTAMGSSTTASGTESTAMGSSTTASGFYSTATGLLTKAEASNVLAIGRYNIGGGNATTWVEVDNLFEVGNGTSDGSRSNAFTILKNGTITAPSFTNSLINTAGDRALITKEYADTNYNPTGLEALDQDNGIGWRLVGRNPSYYGDIGFSATDLSYNGSSSTTRGASGNYSTAMGSGTTASGGASTAMGTFSTASGIESIAMGYDTTASGIDSVAMGVGSEASGNISTAMGSEIKAEAYTSFAIGRYNVGGGNATTWVATDKLFEVGNGTTNISRSNAFTVLKNGNVGIGPFEPTVKLDVFGTGEVIQIIESGNGDADLHIKATGTNNPGISFYDNGVYGGGITYSNTNDYLLIYEGGDFVFKNGDFGIGTITPAVKLQVVGGGDASLSDGSGYLVIGNESATNIVMDTNEIIARNNGATSNLHLQTNGGAVYVGGGLVHSSDRRLKQDIENVAYGLDEILQLRPVSYHWKANPNASQKTLGFVAQEVQTLIKDLVSINENRDLTLALDYNGLIPILVKAIQEQQQIIEKQKNKLDSQKNELNSVTLELAKVNSNQIEILSRLQQLETSLNKE